MTDLGSLIGKVLEEQVPVASVPFSSVRRKAARRRQRNAAALAASVAVAVALTVAVPAVTSARRGADTVAGPAARTPSAGPVSSGPFVRDAAVAVRVCQAAPDTRVCGESSDPAVVRGLAALLNDAPVVAGTACAQYARLPLTVTFRLQGPDGDAVVQVDACGVASKPYAPRPPVDAGLFAERAERLLRPAPAISKRPGCQGIADDMQAIADDLGSWPGSASDGFAGAVQRLEVRAAEARDKLTDAQAAATTGLPTVANDLLLGDPATKADQRLRAMLRSLRASCPDS